MKKCPLCGRVFISEEDISCIDCGYEGKIKSALD